MPLKSRNQTLTSWPDVTAALDEFPPPALTFDDDGDLSKNAWVYRGVGDSSFQLEPTIERAAAGSALGWSELEIEVSEEFKSRSNLYLVGAHATLRRSNPTLGLHLFTLCCTVLRRKTLRRGGRKARPATCKSSSLGS
jgi:hypothetical protein